jgi:hypothetical protein
MYAVEYQHHKVVTNLLAHPKMKINVADGEGTTALMIAVQVALDVNPPPPEPTEDQLKDPAYVPPVLEHIDDTEEVELVETLLKAGADSDSMNHRKRTCLIMVCERSHRALLHLMLNYNAIPDPAVLGLLTGAVLKEIDDRIHAEERKAEAEAARLEREKRELLEDGLEGTAGIGYIRSKNPHGQWVEYNDKRAKPGSGAVFYYNKVSRICQRDKPRNFKPIKNRIVTDAIFGMHFYH